MLSGNTILIILVVMLAILLIVFLILRNRKDRKELITPDDQTAIEGEKWEQEKKKDQL